jgi:hypothetical protein
MTRICGKTHVIPEFRPACGRQHATPGLTGASAARRYSASINDLETAVGWVPAVASSLVIAKPKELAL